MRSLLAALVFLLLLFAPQAAAQEGGEGTDPWDAIFGWDMDAIFGGDPDAPIYIEIEDDDTPAVLALIRQRGVVFEAAFDFRVGMLPGWSEAPWFLDNYDGEFSWAPGLRLRADFGMDAQISEVFGVRTRVYFTIPNFSISLAEFFFDYSVQERVFFRAGLFPLSWGISPNFAFSNLLARVPPPENGVQRFSGSAYAVRADIPIGIGGLQLLALTRINLLGNVELHARYDIAYGANYTLAFQWATFDMGFFNQEGMPVRGLFSINTTIGNTELYNEWVVALDDGNTWRASMAVNLGFFRSFFGGRFVVNGELFFNAEEDAYWFRQETAVQDAEVLPLVDGLNFAANLLYRFGGRGDPRFFMQVLYAPGQDSAQLVPGFLLNPFPHAELAFAVPMALGRRDGYFYMNPLDIGIGGHRRPFSVSLMLTIRGSIQAAQFF